jgi:hypothetical protein
MVCTSLLALSVRYLSAKAAIVWWPNGAKAEAEPATIIKATATTKVLFIIYYV